MDINWQGLITGAVTVYVLTYFTKKASFAAEEGELKFGLFMKGLGLVCLLFSIVPFVVMVTGNYQVDKPGETSALIWLTIGFGVGAIYTLGEGFFVKGRYDQDFISFSTPWTGKKQEKWDNLESVKFNVWCYWYTLKFKSGKVVRLSAYLGGHGHLLEYLEESGHNF
ncbi:hypothetical protein [Teredinibacter turnerae]|uniref:hypothetical protein n=1 Tax=Teredinibacter turnerae TaxID=2426 RepID=UPI00040772F5|nr:hypothetical protein [Teredinibacter turnerae]